MGNASRGAYSKKKENDVSNSVTILFQFESDAYELIGLSTLIYLILAALWMISLVFLLISIKVC